MIPPPIGALSDRVTLHRRVTTGEAEGGAAVSYTPIAPVWARVWRRSASGEPLNDARGHTLTHTVTVRFRADLRAGDRVTYRGRALEIDATYDLDGTRRFLVCQCRERAVSA